jgi:sterol desaturase/sphingolipid hydroxylase (fatty acid hydroxylase superfamily)
MEVFSKVPFFVPLIIYIPVIAYFLYRAAAGGLEILPLLGLFALGVLAWTVAEYILHRFVFHYQPKSKWGQRLHFIFHGVHHDYPRDRLRLVMPPSASIPLAFGFYFLFKLFLPPPNLFAFYPGFVAGYLVYDMMHYAMHHANFTSGWFKRIKQHHMLHHYDDMSKGYGVSSVLWDKIFRSDFSKKP